MQLEEGKKKRLPSPARFNEQGGAPAPCCRGVEDRDAL